ncbi:MAG: HAD family hydrolase [Chloroflexota bacterium]|nr:HAD family hydrolase [Chloroflexota bacterium]
MIEMIAFDADDTLWHNEVYYHNAQEELKEILAEWAQADTVAEQLNILEMRNLPLYGYGVKAFVLSMIKTAFLVSEGQMRGETIERILSIGRSMLEAEIVLHHHVAETLQTLSQAYSLMIITKGDLLDQTNKIERSGLRDYFSLVEIVNDKTADSYRRILSKYHLNLKNFLMIGNSLRSDILPILQLGGKAVLIPADTTWEHEMVPDFDKLQSGFFEITEMCQLPDLIASIS